MAKKLTRKQQALEELKRRQRHSRQRTLGIVITSAVVLALLWWFGNRPEEVDYINPVDANGTAWGPVDAPVTIQVWSDFN